MGGGNSTLINYYNARVVRCPETQARTFIDDYQNQLKKQGIDYFWIPGGGHIAYAAFGYVEASKEIQKQLADNDTRIDAIFLPCGTGTTLSGISYGFSNYNVDIYGVTVARTVERCRQEVQRTLSQMQEIQPLYEDATFRFEILKCDIPYGEDCPEIQNVIKQVAISDGVFLDPIYNAKVFLTMQNFLHSHPEYKNVLYINTGGTPNIFIRK